MSATLSSERSRTAADGSPRSSGDSGLIGGNSRQSIHPEIWQKLAERVRTQAAQLKLYDNIIFVDAVDTFAIERNISRFVALRDLNIVQQDFDLAALMLRHFHIPRLGETTGRARDAVDERLGRAHLLIDALQGCLQTYGPRAETAPRHTSNGAPAVAQSGADVTNSSFDLAAETLEMQPTNGADASLVEIETSHQEVSDAAQGEPLSAPNPLEFDAAQFRWSERRGWDLTVEQMTAFIDAIDILAKQTGSSMGRVAKILNSNEERMDARREQLQRNSVIPYFRLANALQREVRRLKAVVVTEHLTQSSFDEVVKKLDQTHSRNFQGKGLVAEEPPANVIPGTKDIPAWIEGETWGRMLPIQRVVFVDAVKCLQKLTGDTLYDAAVALGCSKAKFDFRIKVFDGRDLRLFDELPEGKEKDNRKSDAEAFIMFKMEADTLDKAMEIACGLARDAKYKREGDQARKAASRNTSTVQSGTSKNILEAVRNGDFNWESESTKGFAPTQAPPGSDEKKEVLAARIKAGLPLWHEGDRVHFGPTVFKDLED